MSNLINGSSDVKLLSKKIIRTNYKFQIECRTIKQISCYMCKLVLSKRFGSFAVTINTKHTNNHKPTKHLFNWMSKAIEKLGCRLRKGICLKLGRSYLHSIICMVHPTQPACFVASKKSSCLLLPARSNHTDQMAQT